MTNVEIIENEKKVKGIEVEAHTFGTWKQKGYAVQKGEKAAFSVMVWKHKTKRNEDGTTEGVMFRKKAYFFTADQVKEVN